MKSESYWVDSTLGGMVHLALLLGCYGGLYYLAWREMELYDKNYYFEILKIAYGRGLGFEGARKLVKGLTREREAFRKKVFVRNCRRRYALVSGMYVDYVLSIPGSETFM